MNTIELERLVGKLEVLKLAIAGLDPTVSDNEKLSLYGFCAELINQVSEFVRKGEESDKQG